MNKHSAIILACLVLMIAVGHGKSKIVTDEETGKIVAMVNGQPVFASQMEAELRQQMRKHKKMSASLADRVRKKVLDKIIDRELLYQAARKLDIPDLEKKIEEELQSTRDRFSTEENFQRYLARNELTMEQLRLTARKMVFIEEYLQRKNLRKPVIAEEDIRQFYNKKTFKREEAVRLKHILLGVDENAKPEIKEEVRHKAEGIRRTIVQGADFSELAKQFSDSVEAKEMDGDLGFIKKGYLPAELDKVAFSLQEGEVSDVVETRFGFHIVKLVTKRSAGMIPYEEVRDFIGRYLQNQRSRQLISAHIEELRAQASIEILPVSKRPLARKASDGVNAVSDEKAAK